MQDQKKFNPKTISRKSFLKYLATANIMIASNFLLSKKIFSSSYYFFNDPKTSLDEKMRLNVAIARAMTNKPPENYSKVFQSADEYEIRKSAAVNLLLNKAYLANDFSFPIGAFSELVLNVDPEPLYKALVADTVKIDIIKGLDNLDKDTVSIIGTSISGVAGLAGAVFPEIVIPMAVVGGVGSGVSIQSSLMQDNSSRQIVGDSSLVLAKLLWNDPKAKKVMTNEIKALMRDVFGIDFEASS